ncbi:MAG: trypsin-like serine protease [Rickettsiales bacterium]|jgi:hypothetical protein|nr:trypsin-like serine protease [Rickettsiales bacterium]
MKILALLAFAIFLYIPAHAGTGSIDKRVYVDDWSQPPYNQIVLFLSSKGQCTAQYVAKDIILTAMHCLNHQQKIYRFQRADGSYGQAELLKHGTKNNEIYDDYALLRVIDSNAYSTVWFDMAEQAAVGKVINAGFGWMRILNDDEVKKAREIFGEVIREQSPPVFFKEVYKSIKLDLEIAGIKPFREEFPKLKADTSCEIKALKNLKTVFGTGSQKHGKKVIRHTIDGCFSSSYYPNKNQREDAGILDSSDLYNKTDAFIKQNNPEKGYDVLININWRETVCNSSLFKTISYITSTGEHEFIFDVICPKQCDEIYKNDRYEGDEYKWMFSSDHQFSMNCLAVSGNSGGPIWFDNQLLGIVSAGDNSFLKLDYKENEYDGEIGIDVRIIKPVLEELKLLSEEPRIEPGLTLDEPDKIDERIDDVEKDLDRDFSEPDPGLMPDELDKIGERIDDVEKDLDRDFSEPEPGLMPDELDELEGRIDAVEKDLDINILKVTDMNDVEFFKFLNKMTYLQVLQENYEKAKARENSTANKLLGAAAMGAGGIGGMMLMQGMAEQAADEAAEADMKAYLATFKCDYGQGQNIRGGEKEITLPAENLISLRSEYTTLAKELKKTKELLGLAPGIESEVILDKASSGLYDNGSTGKTEGVYTSVSKALSDPQGKDGEEWESQKSESASGAKTGGIVAGAGVLGGAVGNLIINKGD